MFGAPLRGIMAESGMRGPLANGMFFVTRLTTDETVENITGVGKPPRSWNKALATVDVLHKAVYAWATGLVADRMARRHRRWPSAREGTVSGVACAASFRRDRARSVLIALVPS